MEFQDYYTLLNVSKTANADEIKKSYRRLARKYHPDLNKESGAEEKFKQVKEAYEVLKDPEKRAQYDQVGQYYQQGNGNQPPPDWQAHQQRAGAEQFDPNEFSDFFSSMFGGGFHQKTRSQRGQDQHSKLEISLHDAFNGTKRSLQLQQQILNPETGQVEIKNKTINVKIPAGVGDGQSIRLSGQGSPGFAGGSAGDLYLEIAIKTDKNYSVDGKNILLTLPITPWEAALGATIEVPTLSGAVKLKIPEGSQTGKKMRLKGKGLPGKNAGDLIVLLTIETPTPTNDDQRQLYQQMADKMAFNPRKNLGVM